MFRRILIWYSLILLVSGMAFVGTRWLLHPRGPLRDEANRRQISFFFSEAIHHYESGGREALRAYLARLDKQSPFTQYMVSPDGRDLATGEDRSAMLRAAAPGRGPRPPGFWRPPQRFLVKSSSPDNRYIWLLQGEMNFDPFADLAVYGWVVALVVLLCYVLAWTLARPIRQLREAVVRFGSGDLAHRIGSKRRDELGDLSRAFDQMADRIQTLLTAERRLLQDVSHELRSPLTRLRFALQLAGSSADPKTALPRVQREVDRLSTLVGELLQVTRAEGDPESRNVSEVSLPDLLRHLVEDAQIEASARAARIDLSVPAKLTWRGDTELLHRAVDNVLRNAIRYTPEGAAVEVDLHEDGSHIVIAVRDFGPGVPEDQLQAIFQPFFRVESDRSRPAGDAGVGLGLAIARRAVAAHHGEVRARNAHPGLLVELLLPR